MMVARVKKPVPTGWWNKALTAKTKPKEQESRMNQVALIARTQSLIAAGDIAGAEAALVELADAEGDNALMVVLNQLPPKDILAIIREYDNSKESVINLMVTPAQFAHAVVIEQQYRDLTRTHLRGMVNSIIFRDGADPLEFLTAIGDLEGGSEALADYFSEKWSRIEAFARTGTFDTVEDDGAMLSETALYANAYASPRLEQDEVADQDWMELAWILRYQNPDLFIEMLLVLRAKARAYDLAEEEESMEDDGKVETGDTDRGNATPVARESDEESAI
jgi:hypothetical protein